MRDRPLSERVAHLEREVAELQAGLQQLRGHTFAPQPAGEGAGHHTPPPPPPNRQPTHPGPTG